MVHVLLKSCLENFISVFSVQFSTVAESCLTLCDPMDCSTPGFPAFHYLLEFAQTHVHWVGDAIQPCRPLSPPSPALNLSQGEQGVGELDIGGQKIQTFGYEINKYWDVSYNLTTVLSNITPVNTVVWKLPRVDPEFSSKGKTLFIIIWGDGC